MAISWDDNALTDALKDLQNIIFGYNEKEKKEIQEDYKDTVEKGKENNILGIPNGTTGDMFGDSLKKDWIPLTIVAVLFFFVIND
jgi:hypothetical protein